MARVEIYDDAIDELAHDPEGPVAQATESAAYLVENEAKRRLLEPGTGKLYTKGVHYFRRGDKVYRFERSSDHQASAPGESPASDVGYLLNRIEHVIDEDAGGVFYRVGANVEYLEYLELGTRYMEPRPLLRPSLDVVRE